MRILHLHCMKDVTAPDAEAASIIEVSGLQAEALTSIRPFETPVTLSALEKFSGVIIGGSAWSVFEDIPHYAAFRDLLTEARRRKLPMFGICFGAQAITHVFGGTVVRDPSRAEYGTIEVCQHGHRDRLFSPLPQSFFAQAWHHDRIAALPERGWPLASSREQVLQAFRLADERIWGVQFHPERTCETFERLLGTRPAPNDDHPIKKIRASLRPTPRAAEILARFIRLSTT